MENQDDKKFAVVLITLAIAILMIGISIGFALTSMSYGQAFKNAEIRVCNTQDLDYANLSIAYQQCKADASLKIIIPKLNMN